MGLGRSGGLLRHSVRHCGGMFAPRGKERRRLLPLRALHAVVADRHLDVRRIHFHELRQHVHRVHPQLGTLRELEVVGVPPHGNADGVRLFAPVGAFRRKERHRVLRAALLRTGGGVSAGIPRDIPRHRVQRDNHRAGDAGGDQDRADALRRGPVDRDRHHRCGVDRLFRAGRVQGRDIH